MYITRESAPLDDLWRQYQATRGEQERDELILHYLYLVKVVVGKLASSYPAHIKVEDLYSSGVTGLIRAVERFDPTRPAKFETYAILLIRGAVIDELRDLDWVPRSVHQLADRVATLQHSLQQELGRDPTDAELAHSLNMDEQELLQTLERIRPAVLISFNEIGRGEEEEGLTLTERLPDQQAHPSDWVAQRNEVAALLEQEIAKLSEKEQKVLMFYYYDGLMLKQIAERLRISQSRVSQIHTQVLLKLRCRLQSIY